MIKECDHKDRIRVHRYCEKCLRGVEEMLDEIARVIEKGGVL